MGTAALAAVAVGRPVRPASASALAGMFRTCVLVVGFLVGTYATEATALASHGPLVVPALGQEGCVSPPDDCSYDPARTGGHVASGTTWRLVVEIPAPAGDARDTDADGRLKYVFDPAGGAEQGCGLFTRDASNVTTNAGGDGQIAAGNPYPSFMDTTLPDSEVRTCRQGYVTPANRNYAPVS